MVDQSTQQLMYKVYMFLVSGVVLLIFGYVMAIGWKEGDGEAIRTAQALAPIGVTAFLGMAGVLGLHTVTGASVAKANINAQGAASSSSPPSTPTPAPATGPVAGVPPMAIADVVQTLASL